MYSAEKERELKYLRGVLAILLSKNVPLHEREMGDINRLVPQAASVPASLSEHGHLAR